MSAVFVVVDDDSLHDALRTATVADALFTAFPSGGYYPRLHVHVERWAVVSWSATSTNGRWRVVDGKVEHRPSQPDPVAYPTLQEM